MNTKEYKRVPLKDSSGREIGHFTYVPGDSMILLRFGHLKSVVHEVTEELEQFDFISPDGKSAGENTKCLRKLEERVCDALDYWLGTESSKHIFNEIQPFACMSGGKEFWYSRVIKGIGRIVFPESAQSENGETV